jgi:hypothetical protein
VNEGHRRSYEGFATPSADQQLAPFSFEHCNVGERGVKIDIIKLVEEPMKLMGYAERLLDEVRSRT